MAAWISPRRPLNSRRRRQYRGLTLTQPECAESASEFQLLSASLPECKSVGAAAPGHLCRLTLKHTSARVRRRTSAEAAGGPGALARRPSPRALRGRRAGFDGTRRIRGRGAASAFPCGRTPPFPFHFPFTRSRRETRKCGAACIRMGSVPLSHLARWPEPGSSADQRRWPDSPPRAPIVEASARAFG
jgi:hypothetical protein